MSRLVLYSREAAGQDWQVYRDFDDFYEDVSRGHMTTMAMGRKVKEHRRGAQESNPTWQFGLGTKNHKPVGFDDLDA